MIQCIAIDDERKALEVIMHYANKIEYLNLSKVFTNPIDAIQYLEQNVIDIIFLDINMPGINGFEFIEAISIKSQIIFTTAYSKYAVESYNVDALDYLVKPITFPRFLKAVNKHKITKKVHPEIQKDSNENLMLIKSGTEIHRINKTDILYIKSEGNYSKIVFLDKNIMTLISIKKIIELLDDTNFIQIHRSYIISKLKIQKIERHQLTLNNTNLPIGVSFRKVVMKELIE